MVQKKSLQTDIFGDEKFFIIFITD